MMKKFFLSIVAALMALPMFAQFGSGGFSLSESNIYYGVRLGTNFSSISGDETDDFKMKTGINLAGVVGMRLSDITPIFLESGLYYTERGAKGKDKEKASLTYLELPVLIKYGIQATDDIAILPFIGPYFSLGFAGKTKTYDPTSDSYSSEGSFKHAFNRLDMGFKLGCGAEYNMLYAEVGYQKGIANIADSDENTMHGNALFLNIGVNF